MKYSVTGTENKTDLLSSSWEQTHSALFGIAPEEDSSSLNAYMFGDGLVVTVQLMREEASFPLLECWLIDAKKQSVVFARIGNPIFGVIYEDATRGDQGNVPPDRFAPLIGIDVIVSPIHMSIFDWSLLCELSGQALAVTPNAETAEKIASIRGLMTELLAHPRQRRETDTVGEYFPLGL